MFTQQFELCKGILRTHFGPIVAQVATVLIHEGRLPLGRLAQKASKTLRQTKESVAVLIQHGIATHAPSKEGARTISYYSVSLRNVLRLERAGLYLALVEERMGKEGLAIFRVFMDNGCATIGEAKRLLEFEAMGSAKQIKFRQAVAKMVNERYITAVRPVDTVTKVDRVMAEERKEIEKLMVPPTAKELKEIRARIKEREDEEYHNTAVIGIKRKAVNYEDSTMEIGGDSGLVKEELAIDAVDEDMFFRAYTDRLDVFLRNQQITNYFADKYNAAAGAVVKTMLRLTEPKTKTCRDKVSTTVSASQVMQNLAHDAPLADSVDLDNDAYFDSLESAKSDGAQAMTRKERAEIVLALLEVVSSDRSGMVRKLEERGAGQFVVDFSNAATALRDQCIDALVHEKFGSLHARTVRILRDKQKLDEKVIAQAVMLPIAQCREKLHDLALEGIIDTLEIPRTADRNPSRMFYLWFINSEKQVRNALRMAFEGIANAMARLDYEVTARDTLTAKANRDDVIANPDLLTEGERDELAKLEATALRLQVACVRLDRMLLVLHDINPSSAELNLL